MERRMERMRRAAATAAERRVQHERQHMRAVKRGELTGALRTERERGREYSKALTAYNNAPDSKAEQRGRELDRAYALAMRATQCVQELRAELAELTL